MQRIICLSGEGVNKKTGKPISFRISTFISERAARKFSENVSIETIQRTEHIPKNTEARKILSELSEPCGDRGAEYYGEPGPV